MNTSVYRNFAYICMVLNEKKLQHFWNKVNSISYTMKIEMIAHFYHLSQRKYFLALEIMRKSIFFPFQDSKMPKLQHISNKYNIFNLGLYSCLETKQMWVKLTCEHQNCQKIICVLFKTHQCIVILHACALP